MTQKQNRPTVWMMNHYAGHQFFDKGGRHYYFAKYLKRDGYHPVIFCSNATHFTKGYFYNTNTLAHRHMAREIDTPFVFVKSRAYEGNGKQRILNMVDFYFNVKRAAKAYAKQHEKPDIILASSVHPLTLVAGLQLAKHFHVPCICEIRDLWPESIVAIGAAKANNPTIQALYMMEKWIYKKADAIIFTMEGGYDYIIERKWQKHIPREKTFHINNGGCIDLFDNNIVENRFSDLDLESDAFKVIYTGTVREANGLDRLVECAERIKDDYNISFLIYGEGDKRQELEDKCREKHIDNVHFKGRVDKKYIPYILSKSDLNLLNYNVVAAALLYRFGASQNKMFDYLASGKPIISNTKINYDIVEKYQCGISRNLWSADDYVKELLTIYHLSKEDYQAMCVNSREAAKQLDFRTHTDALERICDTLVEGRTA